MNKLRLISTVLVLGVLHSCSAILGEEVARLPINEVSVDNDNLIMKETSLELSQGEEISFWSDMKLAYEGDVALRFQVKIIKDGESIGVLEIDPMDKNVTIGEFKSTVNNKTSWKFAGKNADWTVEENGTYIFEGILIAQENPTLKIEKAEIVIRK